MLDGFLSYSKKRGNFIVKRGNERERILEFMQKLFEFQLRKGGEKWRI